MRVGVPTEVKNNEFRVAVTPAGVAELTAHGHDVRVQSGAGAHSSFSDDVYAAAGATIVDGPAAAWDCELVLKVKEPVEQEFAFLRSDLTLFTYLHLAAAPTLTERLVQSGTTGIAYETVQLADRSLPLLNPMSEIAGRLATQVAAHHLMRVNGGSGILLGGVPGTRRGKFVVIGGGTAGQHAAQMAYGLGADVTVLDINVPQLRTIDERFGGHITTLRSTAYTVAQEVESADVVVGSVLIPGSSAPKLVTHDMVAAMRPGSVLVDIAIDQGGCFEDSHPTTHDNPTFYVHDALFYCVANMPGAVPQTSTVALTNATLPYAVALADRGINDAVQHDPALALGVNTRGGHIVNEAVAQVYGA